MVRIPNTAGTSQLLNVNVNSSLESMTTLRPTEGSNLVGVPALIDVNLLMGTPNNNIGSSSSEGRDQQGNASGAVGGFSGRNDTAITSEESSVSASSRADGLGAAQNGNKEGEEGVDVRGTSGGGEEEKVGDGQTALLGMRGRKGGHMYVNK